MTAFTAVGQGGNQQRVAHARTMEQLIGPFRDLFHWIVSPDALIRWLAQAPPAAASQRRWEERTPKAWPTVDRPGEGRCHPAHLRQRTHRPIAHRRRDGQVWHVPRQMRLNLDILHLSAVNRTTGFHRPVVTSGFWHHTVLAPYGPVFTDQASFDPYAQAASGQVSAQFAATALSQCFRIP